MQKEDFQIEINNWFDALGETNEEEDIEKINENLTKVIMEAAIEIGGKTKQKEIKKISTATKNLIQKRRKMIVRTDRDKIEAAELSKAINRMKTQDVRQYNMDMVERALEAGTSLKATKRKLGIGRRQNREKTDVRSQK